MFPRMATGKQAEKHEPIRAARKHVHFKVITQTRATHREGRNKDKTGENCAESPERACEI